jgi:hypothetical protein
MADTGDAAEAAGVTFDAVREMAMALPGAEEGMSYGTPAFRVKGKLFARLREDGESLVLRIDPFERQYLLDAEPDVFYITDHYRGWPTVLVRLPAVRPARLRTALEESWRMMAPRRMVQERDRNPPSG